MLDRILTKPGYKILLFVFILILSYKVLVWTEPVVVVNSDNMVVSVDGNPVYRNLTNFDLRECRIINQK